MKSWAKYRKFLVAVLTTAGIAFQAAYTDSTITPEEWGKIGLSALGTAFVFWVRNDRPVTREDLKRQTDHPLTRQRIRERDDQTF
jgi:hypothetical protein